MPSKRVSLKGKGADLFFGDYEPTGETSSTDAPKEGNNSVSSPPGPTEVRESQPTTRSTPSAPMSIDSEHKPVEPSSSSRVSKLPAASTPASMLANAASQQHHGIVDAIRKAVRVPGKEVSFTRVTPEEKAQITDIVYAYKRRGQKTTENEINRIALNYLLNDYHERNQDSVLALVLAALQA